MSEIPGTTRDVVEVAVDVGGYPVRLADTAGVREEASDAVEEEGIRRALEKARDSNVRVSLLDAKALQDGCTSTDAFLANIRQHNANGADIVVVNKIDLMPGHDAIQNALLAAATPTQHRVMALSTKTGEGFEGFVTELTGALATAYAPLS